MATRVSVATRFLRWEENQRAGMGESEHGASPGARSCEKEAGERLGGGHGISSGMPGTQLCAWLPGEDDSARGGGLGRLGLALGAR